MISVSLLFNWSPKFESNPAELITVSVPEPPVESRTKLRDPPPALRKFVTVMAPLKDIVKLSSRPLFVGRPLSQLPLTLESNVPDVVGVKSVEAPWMGITKVNASKSVTIQLDKKRVKKILT